MKNEMNIGVKINFCNKCNYFDDEFYALNKEINRLNELLKQSKEREKIKDLAFELACDYLEDDTFKSAHEWYREFLDQSNEKLKEQSNVKNDND